MIAFLLLVPVLGICGCMLFGVYLYWQVINKLLSDDDRNEENIRMEDMR